MVTNIYPSPATPEIGSFVRNAYLHLRNAMPDVEIILIGKQLHQSRIYTLISYLIFVARLYLNAFRRCDLVYAHMVFPTGWLCFPIAKLRRIPLIVYAHGGDVVGANKREIHRWGRPGPLGFLKLVKVLTGQAIFNATRIHTCSEFLEQETVRIFGADPKKFLVASMGLSMTLFSPGETDSIRGPRRNILFVGRLTWQKGFDLYLQLAETLRKEEPEKYSFICVGRCHDQEYLARIRNAPDIQHVDGLDQKELPHFYRNAYATIMPSRYEAFGLVAVESLSCGTPVLAFDTGGLRGIVDNGRNGFLFRNSTELLIRFRQLEEDYERIRSCCRESVKRFAIEKEMGLIATDCRKLLSKHAPAS